jgi:hypothetical protein
MRRQDWVREVTDEDGRSNSTTSSEYDEDVDIE